ncbi:hypothetical protein EST38_g3557 [Candolleomyces aberdarensis]|uniref:Uncharacterized protein n=1 Tax=Candolleomyces aberdarensis TaxID=2316362 RepID=A0A4Q2DRY7_9AGAR|nr:hypothetical protein EST38_g3557 [Candolleomyces aberdarensis]
MVSIPSLVRVEEEESNQALNYQGSVVSAIGRGINAIISAIANVLLTIVSAITYVIVSIFDVITDILCCRCFGSRRHNMRTGRTRYRRYGRSRY